MFLATWKPSGIDGPDGQIAKLRAPDGKCNPAHLAVMPPGIFHFTSGSVQDAPVTDAGSGSCHLKTRRLPSHSEKVFSFDEKSFL